MPMYPGIVTYLYHKDIFFLFPQEENKQATHGLFMLICAFQSCGDLVKMQILILYIWLGFEIFQF